MGKKEKVIEDKTFGLKNKKGSKQQKFISQVEKQVKSGGDPRARKIEEERAAEKKRKEAARLEKKKKRNFSDLWPLKKLQMVWIPSLFFVLFSSKAFAKRETSVNSLMTPQLNIRALKGAFIVMRGKVTKMTTWKIGMKT